MLGAVNTGVMVTTMVAAAGLRYFADHMARWAARGSQPGIRKPRGRPIRPSDLSCLSDLGEIACGPGFRH
jgi:hypothetical protein